MVTACSHHYQDVESRGHSRQEGITLRFYTREFLTIMGYMQISSE